MKILFILPEYYPHSGGGISTYYLNYLKALKPIVNQINVLVGSGYVQSDESYVVNGIDIQYLKPHIYQKYLSKFSKFDLYPEYRNNIAASWAMFEQAKNGEGFDVVECVDFGLGFIPWLVNHSKPVVVRLHGSSGQIDLAENCSDGLGADLHRQAELILLKSADVIISHSKANKNYWENILQQKDIEVIYPIYEQQLTTIPLSEKKNNGIVCARIQEWKGPDVLAEALSLIDNTKIKIDWFGRDTPFNNSISKNNQLKLKYPKIWGNIIVSHLPLRNTEIALMQQKAKFAIIPSTWDMFNFTGLEYMNAETLLICSSGAGISELIINGINGFIFEKGNAKALADCIMNLSKISDDDYSIITKNAKSTLSDILNKKMILEANISQYKKLSRLTLTKNRNVFIEDLFRPNEKNKTYIDPIEHISLKKLLAHILQRIIKKFS